MILALLWSLLWTIVAVILGGYILFFGRRALWATLGIIGLAVTANLLAELVAGVDSGWELIGVQAWGLLGVVAAVGALGVVLGRFQPNLAVAAIGFAVGADVALWLYDIAAYVVTDVANLPEQTAYGIGLVLMLIGGFLGFWLVRKDRDEVLVLITVLIGAELIHDALGLSETSSLTAILLLSLTLAGVLVQYADYLRELKAGAALPGPAPATSSVAYFQDLELD